MCDAGWDLVLSFDTDDSEFVRGFEAGRLWEQMRDVDVDEFNQQIHATNSEMALRMCEKTGRRFAADIADDHCWLNLHIGAMGTWDGN
jgi:hypothetical protein